MDAVWGGRFVSESAVTSRVKQVRRALGDDGQEQRLIRTHHGRGYRFVCAVSEEPVLAAGPEHPLPASGPVRYTLSDGLNIAYQVTGAAADGGPRPDAPDIVLITGFVSHLELDWAEPRHAHFLSRLARLGRLIRFDKRGTGMSDRPEGVPDLETRMHDVLAVMDAVGSEQAAVCGYSEGGPMALLLAATHPERVSRLSLYASYARRTWAPDYPWGQPPEERAAYTERLVTEWDWEADIRLRNPSADVALQRWWALRMRTAATPKTVRALMDMNALIDVRDVLPSVRVPTQIVHRVDDPLFDLEEADFLARHIPDAELVVLDGVDHFVAGDPDQLLDAIEPFLTKAPVTGQQTRHSVLSAVVALAGPDEGAVEAAAHALAQAGGRRRPGPLAGGVVLFDGPATAVRAARSLVAGAVGVGLTVAEVPVGSAAVTGDGVDLARTLAERAPVGEVWTSEVAAMLLNGSYVAVERVEDAGPPVAFRATSS